MSRTTLWSASTILALVVGLSACGGEPAAAPVPPPVAPPAAAPVAAPATTTAPAPDPSSSVSVSVAPNGGSLDITTKDGNKVSVETKTDTKK